MEKQQREEEEEEEEEDDEASWSEDERQIFKIQTAAALLIRGSLNTETPSLNRPQGKPRSARTL